ncbi:helix-turn-helix domain-containing protein [Nostoc sp.]|jgi:Zn-dependent peptidase ImmA (M78 family)/DNA-binding XRE family transcriptional regulator|uniref:helix-turn-helix domain-containing protein n=1 Tax=Nostoc sp. TaxID=1180 RepID=UPI001684CFCA|nr:ImmA/IrrE family metallo-endopeptidase [Desmonostoc muscorum FACHB-395]
MIGKRLKLARQGSGLSLRELESKIGNLVSAQAIGKYERDEMMPNSTTLIALAKALGVSEIYLLGQSDLELEGLEFRKKKITSKREETHVVGAVLSRVERYLEIEEIIYTPNTEWAPPREAPFPVNSLRDAEFVAERLRIHWQLGTDPILNLAEFLESQGIKILSLSLNNNVSGLTCWVKRRNRNQVPVIVINADDNGERQRFTLMHELGHMLLITSPDLDVEKVAHRVAGAFLMPASILWLEIGKRRSRLTIAELAQLKQLLGVSMQALTYRCKDLEIIDNSTFQSLFAEFGRRGWRTPPYEPFPVPKEEAHRFERLCFRALAENAISEAKAAELLGLSVCDLIARMDSAQKESVPNSDQPK